MEYVERVPLPEVCLGCEDRAGCLARGESGAARSASICWSGSSAWRAERKQTRDRRADGKACALSQLIPIFR